MSNEGNAALIENPTFFWDTLYYTISSVCIIRNAIKAIGDHLYAVFKPLLNVSEFCRESYANPPPPMPKSVLYCTNSNKIIMIYNGNL